MLAAELLAPRGAVAGVVTDGTVGAATAIGKVGGDFPIPHTLGTKNGGNLFHSFSQFDLVGGESATFTGPNDVSNILARVTGGSASSIDGTLRSTIPGANLFFINPKGVLFGPNAKVEVDGSFTATTADYVKLSGGGRFDATTPANDVLTSAPVASFGFLGPQPASISASGSILTAPTGKNIAFVAGNLSLDSARLTAPSGRVDLWSANAAGEVPAASPSGPLGGAIAMLRARVETSGSPAGSVVIRGGRLTVDRTSIVSENQGAAAGGSLDVRVSGAANILRNSRVLTTTSSSGAAGDVTLRSGSLSLATNALVGSQALPTATAAARSGKVTVSTGPLMLSDESAISASTFGLAAGSTVDVQAGSISIIGTSSGAPTGIFSNTNATGDGGRGGNVRVRTGGLQILSGGSIAADTSGRAAGGDVEVTATNVSIAAHASTAKTGIFADSLSQTDGGPSGTVRLTADRVQITDGGLISTKTLGLGAGGDTEITARELFISRGASAFFTGIAADSPLPGQRGPGGDVRIVADLVRVIDGGQISANTFGLGAGGSVSVRAHTVELTGRPDLFTGISADSLSLGDGGKGGDVEVTADHLRLFNGGRISANTFGGGAGGDVRVRAQDAVIYAPDGTQFTGIAAESVSETAAGAGGNVRVDIPTLTLRGFGTIAANTFGPGAGGDVIVTTQAGSLLNGGRISADTSGLGAGGNIEVNAGTLRISGVTGRRESGIFSESTGTGDGGPGGRVQVRASMLRLADFGSIAATSESGGEGGSVFVNARTLTLDSGSNIAASATGKGVAGSVSIDVQEPLVLRGGSAIRTTSTVSDAGTVSITSATDIELTDSTIAVSALAGNAGQVSLLATGRIYLIDSSVVAEAGLNGGNVFIDPLFVLLDHSRISANAILGAGGNILIVTDTFLASSSAVTASSEASVQGSVQIQSLNVDLSGALVLLPSGLVDVSTQLREQCARRLGLDFSSFLVLGRGGTERTPDEPVTADAESRSRGSKLATRKR